LSIHEKTELENLMLQSLEAVSAVLIMMYPLKNMQELLSGNFKFYKIIQG